MLKLVNRLTFADVHQPSLLTLRLAMQPQLCIRRFAVKLLGCPRLFFIYQPPANAAGFSRA